MPFPKTNSSTLRITQFSVRKQSSKAIELAGSRDAAGQRWSLALRRAEARFECVKVERAWGIGMCPKYGEMHGHVAKTTVERHRYTSSNLATLQVK